METLRPGDIITYRLHNELFGVARILFLEDLSLHNHVHLELYDLLLEAGDGGLDENGDPFERSHDLSDIETAPVVVDHIAVTSDAFEASEPMVVGFREVGIHDLVGYKAWVQVMHNLAVERGMLKENEEPDEEEIEEWEDEEEGDGSQQEADEGEEGTVEEAEETIEVRIYPWHSGIYIAPLGQVMFNLSSSFMGEELATTRLGEFLNSFGSGARTEEIDERVARFLDGDYGAGHELMMYGDPATDALAAHLGSQTDPQLAEDILNILSDMATTRAYEHIARFFAEHAERSNEPLGAAAVRAYCYAVTLTHGVSRPLFDQLPLLQRISNPELADDIATAKKAVLNAPPLDEAQVDGGVPTSTPLGTFGL